MPPTKSKEGSLQLWGGSQGVVVVGLTQLCLSVLLLPTPQHRPRGLGSFLHNCSCSLAPSPGPGTLPCTIQTPPSMSQAK